MQTIKQELTTLISQINNQFPDGPDLKNFPGISKALIVDSLTLSINQVDLLAQYDTHFEVIVLKREIAAILREIRETLKSDFNNIRSKQFDEFLFDVAEVRFLIKDTYLSVVSKDHFRTEAEVIQLKGEAATLTQEIIDAKRLLQQLSMEKDNVITQLHTAVNETVNLRNNSVQQISEAASEVLQLQRTNITAINEQLQQGKDAKNSIDALAVQAQTALSVVQSKANDIQEYRTQIETFANGIKATSDNVTQWTQEINTSRLSFETNSKEYQTLADQSKALIEAIEKAKTKILGTADIDGKLTGGYKEKISDLKSQMEIFLQDQQTKYDSQFKEIESLLPGATSAGLAQAYQDQKKSYSTPIRNWSMIFVFTLLMMIAFSVVIIFMQVKSNTITDLNSVLTALLRYIPFYLPTIWLVAYASKQQSQSKRLQQEYAFKETNAKSFHGHKVQIEELMKEGGTDKELLEKLVETLVFITAQNPSNTLENHSHNDSPPMFRFLEKLFPSFRSRKSDKTE